MTLVLTPSSKISLLNSGPTTKIILTIIVTTILVLIPLMSSSIYRSSAALQNGENASIVLGQPNFTSSYSGENQSGLAGPEGIAIDSKGDVWISDSQNNRVLEFLPPFSNGENASLVIGQQNFSTFSCETPSLSTLCDPQGLAFDKSGDLFVADNGNNRVLDFEPPFTDGEPAGVSIGEALNATTSFSLNSPIGVALDSSNDLWVADEGNQRVLEFAAPVFTNESASVVIGQTNFVSNSSGANQSGLNSPDQITFDHSGDLWVSDSGNSRVLEFRAPLRTGEIADVVIGQPNFTSTLQGPTQSVFSVPSGLVFDSEGNLWVADTFNGRVLQFVPPFYNGENASLVIGKTGFNSTETLSTQSLLAAPEGVAFDPSGSLWVLDTGSNRALEFAVSGNFSTQASLETTASESAASSFTTFTGSFEFSTTSSNVSSVSIARTSSISTSASTSEVSSTQSTTALPITTSHSHSASLLSYLATLTALVFVSLALFIVAVRRRSNRPRTPT